MFLALCALSFIVIVQKLFHPSNDTGETQIPLVPRLIHMDSLIFRLDRWR